MADENKTPVPAMFSRERFGKNEEMFQIVVAYGWFTELESKMILEQIVGSADELIKATVLETRRVSNRG